MENRSEGKTQIAERFRIGLIALFLLLFTSSCGRGGGIGDSGGQVWVPEFLPIELDKDAYSSIEFFGDAFYYISSQRQGDGFCYRLSGYSLADGSLDGGSPAGGSPAGGPLPDIPLRWPDGKDRFVTTLFAMDGDGCFYLMAYVTEGAGSTPHLCKFDAEGSLLYDADISGETDSPDLLAVDGQGRAYIAGRASGSPCIWLYTSEGVYRGAVYPDAARISAMGRAGNGMMYARCHDDSPDGDDSFLAEIEFDNGKMGTVYPDFPKGDSSVLVPGMENSLLSYDRTSAHAYDLTAQRGQALFDWLDQGINGSYVTAVHVPEAGTILAVMRDLSTGSCELALLKKADGSQAARKEPIVLGTLYSNSTLRNAVTAFNRGNGRYRVQIREYLDPETHDQADAIARLNADILSADCPDILDIADLDLKALAAKGLFVDLNEYLEPSGSLDRSDILDNLLDAYTVNGRLITIPSYF